MLPEMLTHSLQPFPGVNHNIPIMSAPAMAGADMTVHERQIARVNWQQQQPSYFADAAAATPLSPDPFSDIKQPPHNFPFNIGSLQASYFSGEQGLMFSHDLRSRPTSVWPDLGVYPLRSNSSASGGVTGGVGGATISRTFSCPPVAGNAEARATSQLEQASSTTKDAAAMAPSSVTARASSSKKRKSVERSTPKKVEGDDTDKRVKVENNDTLLEETSVSPPVNMCSTSNDKNRNREASKREASSGVAASKETKAKVPEPAPKTDYIHVRARRGQATDSHSLAERVRREKISERMKLLQDLVPGCRKITGKASMLDEIINYVQSLQRQVEFLSMKLAAVTPAVDFKILDALFANETNIPACGVGIEAALMGTPPELLDLCFHHFNPLQQPVLAAADQCCGLPAPVLGASCNPVEVAPCTTAVAQEPCSFLGSYDVGSLAQTR